jgi:hypothetical protein
MAYIFATFPFLRFFAWARGARGRWKGVCRWIQFSAGIGPEKI